ncbi:hypothetical protein CAEBREN_22937 [Caenorhabditis brenneri]|uniref:Uncharacterized protein n=1 Tax=Caenorhabditis brenneri TaxID=135651 RepID=G0MYQ9_CAEBE|nr:hypothetical protein CAEBREN_22937 [Caenorhabditis brenneri]
MDTIYEEEEERASVSMSTDVKQSKDHSTEVIQNYIKEQRKLQKASRKFTMKKVKPPKWICTVKGCKWGARDMETMMDHLKKQHPNEKGSQFKAEPRFINNFKYGQPREGSLKAIKKDVKVKKEVEQLEQKIKNL